MGATASVGCQRPLPQDPLEQTLTTYSTLPPHPSQHLCTTYLSPRPNTRLPRPIFPSFGTNTTTGEISPEGHAGPVRPFHRFSIDWITGGHCFETMLSFLSWSEDLNPRHRSSRSHQEAVMLSCNGISLSLPFFFLCGWGRCLDGSIS